MAVHSIVSLNNFRSQRIITLNENVLEINILKLYQVNKRVYYVNETLKSFLKSLL